MTTHTYATIASIATLAAFTVIGPVCAGGDKVAFPENYEAGVLFTTVDRPDNKQFREFYTSAAALEAAKKGEPLPDGTVITMLQYAAKLDAQGNPEKDANGRFIKGNLIGYAVMEKRTGWGSEYPDNCAMGSGSTSPSRRTRWRTARPISTPASPATSRWTSRITFTSTTR
jgi:hypothetical protein